MHWLNSLRFDIPNQTFRELEAIRNAAEKMPEYGQSRWNVVEAYGLLLVDCIHVENGEEAKITSVGELAILEALRNAQDFPPKPQQVRHLAVADKRRSSRKIAATLLNSATPEYASFVDEQEAHIIDFLDDVSKWDRYENA